MSMGQARTFNRTFSYSKLISRAEDIEIIYLSSFDWMMKAIFECRKIGP
jgi:hypothetical protein